eukprot:CAMPEP_0194382644 /NCGR_PEP_ID=MMETSP0174-20130528/61859_1 /TAXON_ID=216777 /ORGANISM="Proboscia alata, Strain PI-D3" /LENGTH=58 /DNA_ID=CAMNT_0039168105 /DNA_START=72 /DNA_END=248 /DNA_ORIENTATION=-
MDSMLPKRVSPILRDTTRAPGATPSSSELVGWWAAAIPATWEPWAPASATMLKTVPSS